MHTPFLPAFRARLAPLGRRVQHLRQQSLCHLELLLGPFLPPGLLPAEPAFDMAVNILTFQPGATLPAVAAHIMEHGFLILRGQGIFRLETQWLPVQAGDVIWTASYCPQWFAAIGAVPASYICYQDVNRDPM